MCPKTRLRPRSLLRHLVNCDPKRIAQVASNLVANAIKHGTPNQLIRVLAATDERSFELAVANQGEPIDPVVIEKLFQPFFRGRASNQGLGLGLYIASEIARAHGGRSTKLRLKTRPLYPSHSAYVAKSPVLLAFHFGPLLAQAHRNFNCFRGRPLSGRFKRPLP
jgi:nitrogen fixation/metabolism regulation signal transduction histidine kinase